MEMRDAQQHKILEVKSTHKGGDPSPVLIIDELYCKTKANKKNIQPLVRDASAGGVIVFLMTKEKEWATKVVTLNDGMNINPLPVNVDNPEYTGQKRFLGTPQWNSLFWPVERLRDLVCTFCFKRDLDPAETIPDETQLTPGEAIQIVAGKALAQQLSN